MTTPYSDLNTYIKTWFWELHNWVNESLGRPIFSYDDLQTYKSTALRAQLNALDVPMQRAIRIRSGQLLGYKEFLQQSLILFSIYGI